VNKPPPFSQRWKIPCLFPHVEWFFQVVPLFRNGDHPFVVREKVRPFWFRVLFSLFSVSAVDGSPLTRVAAFPIAPRESHFFVSAHPDRLRFSTVSVWPLSLQASRLIPWRFPYKGFVLFDGGHFQDSPFLGCSRSLFSSFFSEEPEFDDSARTPMPLFAPGVLFFGQLIKRVFSLT